MHQLHQDTIALTVDEPTDAQLMEGIQRGEERALICLHHRHGALIRAIIRRVHNCVHDVDDLEQECLLEVWRNAGHYRAEKGSALGWIATLVRRRSIDCVRRKVAYCGAQDRFRGEATIACEGICSGADEELAKRDRAKALKRLVACLPVAQQEAVRLSYYEGLSQRQIASHTGIPLGTIKTRLELALRKLRCSVLAFGAL